MMIDLFAFRMQAVASAGGGASLQHSAGLQHHSHSMNHAMMTTGAPSAQVNTSKCGTSYVRIL